MTRNRRIKLGLIYAGLTLFLIIVLLPYFWLILTSFKTRVDAFSIPPKLIFKPTLSNYHEAFISKGMLSNLKNSVIVMVFTVVISLALGLPSSFAFSRFRTKYDKMLLNYLLGTRFTPFVVLALPLYLMMSKMRLLNTFSGIIVAHVAFNLPFTV